MSRRAAQVLHGKLDAIRMAAARNRGQRFYRPSAPDRIVVELKAIKNIDDSHFVIVRSYLRAAGLEHGLLLNFANPTLDIRRVLGNR